VHCGDLILELLQSSNRGSHYPDGKDKTKQTYLDLVASVRKFPLQSTSDLEAPLLVYRSFANSMWLHIDIWLRHATVIQVVMKIRDMPSMCQQ